MLAGILAYAAIFLPGPASASAEFPSIRFTAREAAQGDIVATGVRFSLDGSGSFAVSADQVKGALVLEEGVSLTGVLAAFEVRDDAVEASGRLGYQGLEADWSFVSAEGSDSLCLVTDARPLKTLQVLAAFSEQLSWVKSGAIDACAHYRQPPGGQDTVDYAVAVQNLSFDSPDGLFAAEGLEMEVGGSLEFDDPPRVALNGTLLSGEVLIDNFYANFSAAPLSFSANPAWNDSGLSNIAVSVHDDGAMRLEAGLYFGQNNNWRIDISRLELAFPGAYRRYIEPIAAVWTLDGLEVSGEVRWEGSFAPGSLRSGDLEITDLSIVDIRRSRFALTGLDTRLRPGQYDENSRLSWRGLLVGKVNLGAGSALLDSEPGAFALLEPLELGVLGGRLDIGRLQYRLPGETTVPGAASRFEIQASLRDIDMERLTSAFGWPTFTGKLSGEIPGARLLDGVLSVDGEVKVEVFDGVITVSDLEVERLFGVLPSLSADVRLAGLDLEMLTETFEFGRIGGRIDGHVRDLRMLEWRPVAFDAWLGTPESQAKSEAISRQAVNHLTTIGGGGATTALTSPIMRMFNNFSYRRLGLGCRLQNNVCEIKGISEDAGSVLLLEGAGLPRITVRAWNRAVDWPQMVDNLVAVTSGESIQVGDTPPP